MDHALQENIILQDTDKVPESLQKQIFEINQKVANYKQLVRELNKLKEFAIKKYNLEGENDFNLQTRKLTNIKTAICISLCIDFYYQKNWVSHILGNTDRWASVAIDRHRDLYNRNDEYTEIYYTIKEAAQLLIKL